MANYLEGTWPWWLGALALAITSVGYFLSTGYQMGVSGIFGRLMNLGHERRQSQRERELLANPAALEAALASATRDAFGQEALDVSCGADESKPLPVVRSGPPVGALVTFLIMLAAGGALGGWFSGNLEIRWTLGPDFARWVASDMAMWLTLLLGGLLVGFGSQMAGGCTAGHGLSGCSRLQLGSLLSTASFFGTGILVSFLLNQGMP